MPSEVNLPELGENVESGDVLRVLVKPGDHVKKDQPVIELETDKATVEVPSSAEGVVREVKVKAGEKVTVGQTILMVDADGSAEASATPAAEEKPQPPPAEAARPGP